jgi:hypothetical protein
MTIAAVILDFYDDSKHELMAKVAAPQGRLGAVNLAVLTPEQHEGLPDSEFGLVILTKRAAVLRKYPVNDPGNAWLSAQYFQNTHTKLAFPARYVAAKFIKTACDAYGVPSSAQVVAYATRADDAEVDTNTFVEGSEHKWLMHKLAQRELLTKQAAAAEIDARLEMPNEHFALVIKNEDGAIIRKYAMPDALHVKTAANYFDKYAMQLAPEHRHRFAVAVQGRAEELNVDLSDNELLEKWASTEWNRHVVAHLEQRKSLLPRNEPARAVLDKLAASLGETTPEDAAYALQTLDQSTGLTKYYDRGLTDPFASTMAKVGSGWSDEVDDHTLTESDLRKVGSSKKLASYLGEAFARQFAENPIEIYDSLPDPEKVLIKQISTGEA